jgi:hypothetical protein
MGGGAAHLRKLLCDCLQLKAHTQRALILLFEKRRFICLELFSLWLLRYLLPAGNLNPFARGTHCMQIRISINTGNFNGIKRAKRF